MAKVTIVIEDVDGKVQMNVRFSPSLKKSGKLTPAQVTVARLLSHVEATETSYKRVEAEDEG